MNETYHKFLLTVPEERGVVAEAYRWAGRWVAKRGGGREAYSSCSPSQWRGWWWLRPPGGGVGALEERAVVGEAYR